MFQMYVIHHKQKKDPGFYSGVSPFWRSNHLRHIFAARALLWGPNLNWDLSLASAIRVNSSMISGMC